MNNPNEFRKYAVHHMGMSGNALDSYTKYINENAHTVYGMTPNVVEERQMRATVIDVFRSEEHTSELQSLTNLVCRLLLEKKKKKKNVQVINRSKIRTSCRHR